MGESKLLLPRADKTGKIGKQGKAWGEGWFDKIYAGNEQLGNRRIITLAESQLFTLDVSTRKNYLLTAEPLGGTFDSASPILSSVHYTYTLGQAYITPSATLNATYGGNPLTVAWHVYIPASENASSVSPEASQGYGYEELPGPGFPAPVTIKFDALLEGFNWNNLNDPTTNIPTNWTLTQLS